MVDSPVRLTISDEDEAEWSHWCLPIDKVCQRGTMVQTADPWRHLYKTAFFTEICCEAFSQRLTFWCPPPPVNSQRFIQTYSVFEAMYVKMCKKITIAWSRQFTLAMQRFSAGMPLMSEICKYTQTVFFTDTGWFLTQVSSQDKLKLSISSKIS